MLRQIKSYATPGSPQALPVTDDCPPVGCNGYLLLAAELYYSSHFVMASGIEKRRQEGQAHG